MEFNIHESDYSFSYKLMTNLIMPRPIAWITTVDAAGVVNAAPFSFLCNCGLPMKFMMRRKNISVRKRSTR